MIRRLRAFLQKLWPTWIETEPLHLDGLTDTWWHSRHDASVEVLWKGEKYREHRSGWMLR